MVCKGMGFVVVVSQLSEVAMDVIGIAAFRFQLDSHVSDTEVHRDAGLDQLQQIERGAGLSNHHMRCQHDQAWLDRPDMKIVHILDAGNRLDGSRDVRGANGGRC